MTSSLSIRTYALKKIQDETQRNSQGKKKKMEEHYDRNVSEAKRFQVEDKARMKNHVPKSKFDEKWLGPMDVLGRIAYWALSMR